MLLISRDDDGKIELYLKNGFKSILRRCKTSMQSQWPTNEDLEILIGAAAGSFNYASTVIRFVDHHGLPGFQKRLSAIIDNILNRRKHDPHAGTSGAPFAELDAFYMLILRRIPKEVFPSVHLLLGVICQYGLVGAILAANILGVSKDDFEIICNHASAVVLFQHPGKEIELDPAINTSRALMRVNLNHRVLRRFVQSVGHALGGEVSLYHKSFRDFLLDPERSGIYYIGASEALKKRFYTMHLYCDLTYCWEGSGRLYTIPPL